MWDSGVHINCFYEWWKTKEYRIGFRNEESKADFLHEIEVKKGWIWERLPALQPHWQGEFWLRKLVLDSNGSFWYNGTINYGNGADFS